MRRKRKILALKIDLKGGYVIDDRCVVLKENPYQRKKKKRACATSGETSPQE